MYNSISLGLSLLICGMGQIAVGNDKPSESRDELEKQIVGYYVDALTPQEIRQQCEAIVKTVPKGLSAEEKAEIVVDAVKEVQREQAEMGVIYSYGLKGNLWILEKPPTQPRKIHKLEWSLEKLEGNWHIAIQTDRGKNRSRILSVTDAEFVTEYSSSDDKFIRRLRRLDKLPDWATGAITDPSNDQ